MFEPTKEDCKAIDGFFERPVPDGVKDYFRDTTRNQGVEASIAKLMLFVFTSRTYPWEWNPEINAKFKCDEGDGRTILVPVHIPAGMCNTLNLVLQRGVEEGKTDLPDVDKVLKCLGELLIKHGLSDFAGSGNSDVKGEMLDILEKAVIRKMQHRST